MFTTIVSFAVSMIFLFLMFSAACSAIQEIVSNLLRWRAKTLEKGLAGLFLNEGFKDELYRTPLLEGLCSPNTLGNLTRKPSYIPSATLAMAVLQLAQEKNMNLTGAAGALAATDSLAKTESLLRTILKGSTTVEEQRAKIEDWYNDSMDRVSGWYKRYTQRVLVVIGLLLAIAFNVNSVRVARTLWLDRDARQAMVDAAGNYAKDHPAATNQAAPADTGKLREQLQSNVDVFSQVTTSALLPLGWKHPWHFYEDYFRVAPKDAIFAALTIVAGWVMTALAISFGAPFWFDTLNKFMVVRSTVKPQEKSKTETAKG